MNRRLLDLFCGAGGAAVGYMRAGFSVVGVDIRPQPNYPFEFVQADALQFLRANLKENFLPWDAIHASPPCQRYIRSGNVAHERHSDLLGPTRELLEQTGLPWVIENVPGAPMRPDAVLCGSHFGLAVRRHRWFEFSTAMPLLTLACRHDLPIHGVYGGTRGGRHGAWPGMLPDTLESRRRALGIDWMSAAELSQAIPPAYTELIGHQLLQHLRVTA